MSESVDVAWSALSIVEATISMLQVANEKKIHYNFAILLSGEDILIKSSYQLKLFLSEHNCSFVELAKSNLQKQRILRFHLFRQSKNNRKTKKTSHVLHLLLKKLL